MKFRSNFEADFARILDKKGIDFFYECDKIPYQPRERVYNPDFFLPDYCIYVETKGRLTQADRVKHLLIKEQQPDYDIRFVFMNADKKLYKGSNTTYASWCDKNGFLWSEKSIPEDWLDG